LKSIIVLLDMSKKFIESGPFPEANECSGSGGGTNGGNFTCPLT